MSGASPALSGLLGPGVAWTGDIHFEGRVRIDGHLTGNVSSGDLLEVGPHGKIDGNVDVAQALVAGEIQGSLTARERCTLLETARIGGRLATPWLDARLGCRIAGEVRVERPESA